ncbi:MAG: ribosome silencing factor [Limisphaerales bacterium]|jgi:ribosome-associated protein|nr:ribosome silencing factor [Verrucomicrobiota bacterium]
MNSRQLVLTCMELADNRKAENIVALDVRKLTSVADYFVICTGLSESHLKAIINEIEDQVFKIHRIHPRCMDGMIGTNWVVLDYGDVIVHVMRADTRLHYDLESFWGDARQLGLHDKEALLKLEPDVEKPVKKARVRAAMPKKTAGSKSVKASTKKPAASTKKVETKAVAKKATAKPKVDRSEK